MMLSGNPFTMKPSVDENAPALAKGVAGLASRAGPADDGGPRKLPLGGGGTVK